MWIGDLGFDNLELGFWVLGFGFWNYEFCKFGNKEKDEL